MASGACAITSSGPSAGSRFAPALGHRVAPDRAGLLRQVEDRHPGFGQLGGDRDVLRADGGQGDRDALADGMVDQLERLAQPGAPLQRQLVVPALVGQPVAAPDHPADLDDLAGPADRRVVRHAVPALDHLRAGRAEPQREPAARDVVQPGRGHPQQRGRARVQREDPRRDLHPLGLGRDITQLAHRVEAVGLGHEHDVDPGPLEVGQLHHGLGESARIAQKHSYPHARRVSRVIEAWLRHADRAAAGRQRGAGGDHAVLDDHRRSHPQVEPSVRQRQHQRHGLESRRRLQRLRPSHRHDSFGRAFDGTGPDR